MSELWFFRKDGDRIEFRARVTGDGGLVGDARDRLDRGDGRKFFGLTFEALAAARSGSVEIVKGKARIVDE